MTASAEDLRFMGRALVLARRGLTTTSPNPMVGAVLVRNGRIVSEGFHRFAGRPHAEALALRKDRECGPATLYVTLEPCVHHGKTLPCVDAILESTVRRVVIGARDPDRRVNGKGIARLKASGLGVTTGVLEGESRFLNRMFFHFHKTGLPYVIVKWAATLDGQIADSAGLSSWITSEAARSTGKKIREEVDAILVGARTVQADDPRLDRLREHPPRRPLIKVILDPAGAVSARARLFREGTVLWFTSPDAVPARVPSNSVHVRLRTRGGRFRIRPVLERLAVEGIQSVLVEGGGETIGGFLAGGCVQEAAVFTGPFILGEGVPAVSGFSLPLASAWRVEPFLVRRIGADFFLRGILCSRG